MRRPEAERTVLVALVGSFFFALLFLWGAHGAWAGEKAGAGAAGPVTPVAAGGEVHHSISGELGGWIRSGRFTLVIRGGSFEGTKEIALLVDGSSCRLEPEGLLTRGVLLRCEMALEAPVIALHRVGGGEWREQPAERFVDRGYAQVVVPVFGEYRFEAR